MWDESPGGRQANEKRALRARSNHLSNLSDERLVAESAARSVPLPIALLVGLTVDRLVLILIAVG